MGCNKEGIVTSNTSECINSMIEEYQGESWPDLLEGVLCHMTQRISDKKQKCNNKRGDDIVPKVKAILGKSFHKATALEVVKLVWGRQYMVTEKRVLHLMST